MSDVRRASADSTAGGGAARIVQDFGTDLFGRLAATPGNVVCSPYSVAVALAMARNGARGKTAVEMDHVMHTAALDQLNAGMNTLQQRLAGRTGMKKRSDGSAAMVTLQSANSLWGQTGVTWVPAFLDALARYYGTGMRRVDYQMHASEATSLINAWASEQTHGRIPEIIPPGVLEALTRLVLVNAIYLKAPWEQPFQRTSTRAAPFTLGTGSRVAVPMMSADLHTAGYAEGAGCRAVSLRYAGAELAMAVIVPDDIARPVDAAALGGMLARFETTNLTLTLPRWTFRSRFDLSTVLQALGMPSAFNDRADFSGMTTQERLYIKAVLHQAFIAVDEQGTEAAAATAVVMDLLSLPATHLTVDRPFLFVIYDVGTLTPLFLGRVVDPR